jgi:hypothetical protein
VIFGILGIFVAYFPHPQATPPDSFSDTRSLRMPGTKTLKSISVDLEVLTPDRLKKVVFGLDKSVDAEGEHWTIDFQFLQRAKKTDEFGDPLVTLSIEVKKNNNAAAEETAMKGLNSAQTEHLLGPGVAAVQRLTDGKTTEDKVAAAVERTLPKRNA